MAARAAQALVDGIFGFAMTLLVLDLLVPGLSGRAVGPLASRFFSYGVAFLGLGLMWISHHSMMRYVDRIDRFLQVLHVLFLAAVALVPVGASRFGSDWDDRGNAIVFVGSVGAVWVGLLLLWVYAAARGLLAPSLTPRRARAGAFLFLPPVVVSALAMAIAWLSPRAAGGVIAALILVYALPGRARAMWGTAR